jgi:hypothetical protein
VIEKYVIYALIALGIVAGARWGLHHYEQLVGTAATAAREVEGAKGALATTEESRQRIQSMLDEADRLAKESAEEARRERAKFNDAQRKLQERSCS